MPRILRFALVAALLTMPKAASAADIPVNYTAEEKPLKAAIAGTNLAFALYSNAACTTLVHSASVPVENVTLILKLKQATPKNDIKLPNTVELRTTLTGATAATPLYLKVTETGGAVVPVGGTCQAQAAGVQGPASALPRTVFVPAEGTPAANGTALLAAAAGITGNLDRPTTLQLDDGEYDIVGTTLALNGIVLAGRSPEHTVIYSDGDTTITDTQGAAVRTNSAVRDISISVNDNAKPWAGGIVVVGFVEIDNTHINVSNAQNAVGIWTYHSELEAREVRVNVSSTNAAYGIRNDSTGTNAQTRVFDSKVVAISPAALQGEAIRSEDGEVRVTRSLLDGSSFYANAVPGTDLLRLRASALSGASGGAVSCLGSTTAVNAYTTTCPNESWSTGND